MSRQIALPIEEPSQVAEARRQASALLAPYAIDGDLLGRISLAVTEAATNILKHATRGRVVLRALERAGKAGLELLALDQGPGIADVARSLRDGYSTAGTLGSGLGALARAGSALEVYSRRGGGTALRLELWAGKQPPEAGLPEIGVVSLPKPREDVAGDQWSVQRHRSGYVALVADGLGHGPDAAMAARAAVRVLDEHPDYGARELVESMHGALARTRGAAIGVARIEREKELGSFVGVGNIAALAVDPQQKIRRLASTNGIVGHRLGAPREFFFPFPHGSLLLLHSDGLGTHWELESYPGLTLRHPGLIAGVLYRDFDRQRDDVTVLALCEDAAGS